MREPVSLAIRENLLRTFSAPLGTVNVLRRPSPEGDIIVVRTRSASTIPPVQKVSEFCGYPVIYEATGPVRFKSSRPRWGRTLT